MKVNINFFSTYEGQFMSKLSLISFSQPHVTDVLVSLCWVTLCQLLSDRCITQKSAITLFCASVSLW